MLDFQLDPEAAKEIEDGMAYYNTYPPGRGDLFRESIYETIRQLCQFPKLGRIYDGPIRKRVVNRFGYIIYYVPYEEYILILAVTAGQRRSDYWRERLDQLDLPEIDTPTDDDAKGNLP